MGVLASVPVELPEDMDNIVREVLVDRQRT